MSRAIRLQLAIFTALTLAALIGLGWYYLRLPGLLGFGQYTLNVDLLSLIHISLLARSGGVYGDFFNFYLCDVTLKINGLQPGGPVRTVKIASQPSGRCALQ